MKIFIAIDFTPVLKAEASTYLAAFKELTDSGIFTKTVNFHITLAYLGEIADAKLVDLIDAIKKIRFKPFDMHFNGVSTFVRYSTTTHYLEPDACPAVYELHDLVTAAIANCQLNYDDTPFIPHATLGIKVEMKPGSDINHIKALLPPSPLHVNNISVMETTKIDGDLVYITHYQLVLEEEKSS